MPVTFSWPVTPPDASPAPSPIPDPGSTEAGATALRDEALDPLTGDQLLDSNADQVWLVGQDGVASDVKARWQTVKGEWYLDTSIGVDWFGVVFVKDPDLTAVRAEFVREALLAPGVIAVPQFDMVFDTAGRSLGVDFKIQDDLGNIISDSATLTPGGVTP